MAEVNVEINGRKYRMACEDGQETHLTHLAGRFNKYIDDYRGAFGEIGDNRLTVMAGIAVVDELSDAEQKIKDLNAEIESLRNAGSDMANESEAMENQFVSKLSDVARRIDSIATAIDANTTDAL